MSENIKPLPRPPLHPTAAARMSAMELAALNRRLPITSQHKAVAAMDEMQRWMLRQMTALGEQHGLPFELQREYIKGCIHEVTYAWRSCKTKKEYVDMLIPEEFHQLLKDHDQECHASVAIANLKQKARVVNKGKGPKARTSAARKLAGCWSVTNRRSTSTRQRPEYNAAPSLFRLPPFAPQIQLGGN